MAQDFASVLRTLREARGLSQSQLAMMADLSPSVVSRAETQSRDNLRRSTKIHLLSALQKTRQLTEGEYAIYTAAADLPPELVGNAVRVRPQYREGLANRGQVSPFEAFMATLDDADRAAYEAATTLIDDVGPDVAMQAMHVMLSMGRTIAERMRRPAHAPTLRSVSPPIQREGYVEQIITEYGPAAPPDVDQGTHRKAGG